MQARMKNPAMLVPEALPALMALGKAVKRGVVPAKTLDLVHLRASQINGCAFCLDLHSRELLKNGDTQQRAFAVSAWRESPLFNDAERAALALTEAMTRMDDRTDPVPDAVWQEAARHYDEAALSTLVLSISMVNLWNRLNVTTRQVPGTGF
ncbi:carboxymuconolactone decarboxylase family protein [Pyxidicoccus fallax]|uniref:Carboxymuconolactone decarboxylase family protein n=1 Tax=Pyxidicoccus fallax TaxID=394095 RepID=A0A848L7X8_9BACT|nr:carboxymuconolactone decarboxylase family protein [Pyxidicoccus fallax]NMO14667.1 carboxymuconolactone decarboxylase family protein [Pyxidicoccus fallax]NPC78458.1 carboxymuconolactone decarboxylase family protein [Pyxidicoccus fallax]